MPEVKLNIGAMVDVASTADVQSAMTGLQGHIDRKMSRQHCQPIRRNVKTANSTGETYGTQKVTQIASDKTPSVGKLWVIRSISVFDALAPLTGADASAIGCLNIGDYASPTPNDMAGWTFTGIPAATTFNKDAQIVKANENIYVEIAGTISGNLSFTCSVDEWNENEFMAMKL